MVAIAIKICCDGPDWLVAQVLEAKEQSVLQGEGACPSHPHILPPAEATIHQALGIANIGVALYHILIAIAIHIYKNGSGFAAKITCLFLQKIGTLKGIVRGSVGACVGKKMR